MPNIKLGFLVLALGSLTVTCKQAAAADSAPAWPQSRTECEDWARNPSPVARAKLQAELPERYLVRLTPIAGGYIGSGLGGEIGGGWRAGASVDVGALSPLWLRGSVAYAGTSSQNLLHVDVLTGFAFVRWGTRWVEAGAAQAGGAVVAWGSHCQHRRNELALQAGGKLILASKSLTALQVGIGETFRRDGGAGDWSLVALYDPVHPSYGAQLKIGAAGGFLPYPVYLGTVMGGMLGERKSFWGTLDVGATFEL